MEIDSELLGPPPPGCSIRIIQTRSPLILTNAPSEDSSTDTEGPWTDNTLVRSGRQKIRAANLFLGIFLLAGLVFDLVAILAVGVFDVPFTLNQQPVDKSTAILSLVFFGVCWTLFLGFMWFFTRRLIRAIAPEETTWELSLDAHEWCSRSIPDGEIIGRCPTDDIGHLEISPAGVLVVRTARGRIKLTGPMLPQDGRWLHRQLSRLIAKSDAEDADLTMAAGDWIPTLQGVVVPGKSLRWQLKSSPTAWGALAFLLVFALFWNGIVSVFVWSMWSDRNGGWFERLFMIPFVLVGLMLILAIFYGVYRAIVQSRIGPTLIEINDFPLVIDQTAELLLKQSGPLSLRRLTVELVCEEEVEYVAGTSKSTFQKVVRTELVCEEFDIEIASGDVWSDEFSIKIPADAMHSFESPNNRIRWKLIVKGSPTNWPSFDRTFAVVLVPSHLNQRS